MNVTLADVQQAAARIEGFAHRTPVVTCRAIDERAGRAVHFKCENFQKVGAFKFRGAMNSVAQLSEENAAHGVIAHSSGNHAQALALAARIRGIPAYIVMPSNAPSVKRRAVEEYGATVYDCAPTLVAREETTAHWMEKTGAALIHPYDADATIAGQGTAALEFLEQVPELEAIITPVGGGGLLGGTCVAAHGLRSDLTIFAGEPAGADDAARSMATGTRQPQNAPDTIADGLLTGLGERNWAIIREHVDAIVTVDDAATLTAMRLVWERAKLIIEPSSAVALAAVLDPAIRDRSDFGPIGVILTGGNVDFDSFRFS